MVRTEFVGSLLVLLQVLWVGQVALLGTEDIGREKSPGVASFAFEVVMLGVFVLLVGQTSSLVVLVVLVGTKCTAALAELYS